MDQSLPVLIQRWNDFMENTKLYRQSQEAIQKEISCKLEASNKEMLALITEIKEGVLKLPCAERAEVSKNTKEQLRLIWLFIVGIVLAVIGSWFKK